MKIKLDCPVCHVYMDAKFHPAFKNEKGKRLKYFICCICDSEFFLSNFAIKQLKKEQNET